MTDVDAPVNVKDNAGNVRIILGSDTLKMIDKTGNDRIIMGDYSEKGAGNFRGLKLLRANAQSIFLDSYNGRINLGGIGSDGEILLKNSAGVETIRLIGSGYGEIRVSDNVKRETFKFDSYYGALYIGCEDHGGDIIIRNDKGVEVFRLKSKNATLMIGYEAKAGEDGYPGQIIIRDGKGKNVFDVHGDEASLAIGAEDRAGSIRIRDQSGKNSIRMQGSRGNLWLGSQETNGDLMLFSSDATGTKDYNDSSQASIHLNGQQGDIILRNADCAEEFDISSIGLMEIEPGTVMVLDDNGKLKTSSEAYDKNVAGVISGAGDCKPGIILDKKKSDHTRVPLAMVGKVFCKVDANYSQIKPGDMLTTSPTSGHAMKAANRSKAFGAVIGKALRTIKSGKALIPILIALQ